MTLAPTAPKFERETCSRCSGSGRHSYCQMYGDRCFKCGGSGKVLTARGAAAYKWFREQRSIPAAQVVPGMVIKSGGQAYNVQSVVPNTRAAGKSLQDGVWVDMPLGVVINGKSHTLHCQNDHVVEVVPDNAADRLAELVAAIAYQNTLTKAGKPRKRS